MLKELYEKLENGWYDLLDKVNASVPVYKIIDPIDKVVPSFALLLGAVGLIALLLLWFFVLPMLTGPRGDATLTVKIETESGSAVRSAAVEISFAGETRDGKTGSGGEAVFENIPMGSEVKISVTKTGYEDAGKTIRVSQKEEAVTITMKAGGPPPPPDNQVTITFVGPDGKKASGVTLYLDLRCSSGAFFDEPQRTTTTGDITVTPPQGCGTIVVNVSGDDFRPGSYYTNGGTVRLQGNGTDEMDAGTGSIIITVKDENGTKRLSGIKITVYDSYGTTAGSAYTSMGEAEFTLAAGDYVASLDDEKGDYASESLEFSMAPGDELSETVTMGKMPGAILEVSVEARESGASIEGAIVFLRAENGAMLERETGNSGIAQFTLSPKDRGKYYASATAEGFIASDETEIDLADVKAGETVNVELALEKCTPQKCGLLKVKVIDEDSLKVQNAEVSLFNAETGFWAKEYGKKATDVNGAVEFANVRAGKYYALAQKYPATGQSEHYDVDPNATGNEIIVNMVIGNGTLRVEVTDVDNAPVPFADVEIKTQGGEELGTIPALANGIMSREFKADKSVYVVVRKEGYTTFTSTPVQIFPDRVETISAKLEEEILGDRAKVELLGIFEGSKEMENLSAGKKYTIKMRLRVPSEGGFDEVGLHVRTGTENLAEKDKIYINWVNAPYSTVLKGSTYNAPLGNADGTEEITNGDAKWASIVWGEPEAGIYNADIEVRVRSETTRGFLLPFYYRAWSLKNGEYLRDPQDDALGSAAETAEKGALYAEAYVKNYFEGTSELCDDEFCYSERVYDIAEGMNLTQTPYPIRVTGEYRWEFTITNNSQTIHDNANIRVKNTQEGTTTDSVVRVQSYTLTNADGKVFTGSKPTFELEQIDAGKMGWNKSVKGELMLQGRELEESNMGIKIVSAGNVVFDKLVPFEVYSEKDVRLTVKPDVIPSLTPTELKVTAEYEDEQEGEWLELEKAFVTVTITTPDKAQSREPKYTDKKGIAKFDIPASAPGTKIKIRVEKPGYATKTAEKEVSAKVVSFEPESLASELNLTDALENYQELKITNLTTKNLKISSMHATGRLYGLLDLERMDSWLGTQLIEIKEGETESISFQTALNEEIAGLLKKVQSVEGKLVINMDDSAGIGTWSFEVPFRVSINPTVSTKYENCLAVSIKEWNDTIFNGSATITFTVSNNCVDAKDKPMALKNLRAGIKWNSDSIGLVKLTAKDLESGETAPLEVLQERAYAPMFSGVPAGAEYEFAATFTPKPSTEPGSVAKFDIMFEASLLGGTGEETVNASNAIASTITVANMEKCVTYEPNPEEGVKVTMDSTKDKLGEFKIINNCGNAALDFRFCHGDNGCKGGTEEGGITLGGIPDDRVIKDLRSGEDKTITIKSAEMPGIYGVTIEARAAGGAWVQIAVMDVIVHPRAGTYIDMDKYKFTIIGKGAKDSAKVVNTMVHEPVKVKADLCAWGEAVKDKKFSSGQIAGISAGAGLAAATIAVATDSAAAYAIGGAVLAAANSVAPGAALAAGAGVIGLAVVVVAVIALLAFNAFNKKDCHDDTEVQTLEDYVILLAGGSELAPDARGIFSGMDKEVAAKFNLMIKEYADEKEYVGAVFENIGAQEQGSVYSVASLKVTEHVHGDPYHKGNAFVECDNGHFRPWWIGASGTQGACKGAYDQENEYKFHLRFRTGEEKESLPQTDFDTYPCMGSSGEIGRTGTGAVPQVKLDWSWNEPEGIAYNSCDADNPEGVYCDATQFSIELSKRLYRLHEFLKINGYDFTCPDPGNSANTALAEKNAETGTHVVSSGKLGLRDLTAEVSGKDVEATATVHNKTTKMQDADVKVILQGANKSDECTINIKDIGTAAAKEGSCEFGDLDSGTYALLAQISSVTTTSLDNSTVSYGFMIAEEASKEAKAYGCEFSRNTETYYGVPNIVRFVEETENVRWTADVHNINELRDLLKFNAYLMKDGYTTDFKKDFVQYYNNTPFMDTPTYFTDLENGKGLDVLFDSGLVTYTEKFINETETKLASAGIYEVEIAAYFGKDWRFFDDKGKANTAVAVVLYRLKDAYPNSPLYSMPFDGLVGLEGETFDRQGYGTGYDNFSAEDMLQINNDSVPVKTYMSAGSNPISNAETEIVSDFKSLNSDPETRGALLVIDRSGGTPKMSFMPSRATPVMMKVSREEATKEPFAAFYTVTMGGSPITVNSGTPTGTGSVLTYWDGAGNCLDFGGTPVWKKFYQQPDRQADSKDGISAWQNAYAMDWEKALYGGNVFLRTIFYTSPYENMGLAAAQPGDTVKFFTPDGEGLAVELNGINGMEHNKKGGGSLDTIYSMEDIFSLVGEQAVCATSTGNQVKFWWNPQKIYTQKGDSGTSISEMTTALSPYSAYGDLVCIGGAG
ncbi:MAG: hypothetical protein V1676_03685 [Candidatus Diapherotrites archaeon]